MAEYTHKGLSNGGWQKLTLQEQLGNVGSEVLRTARAKDRDLFWKAVWRALELFDLTLADFRWRGRLREVARAREVFCDAVYGGKLYKSDFASLQKYFDQFALAASLKK